MPLVLQDDRYMVANGMENISLMVNDGHGLLSELRGQDG